MHDLGQYITQNSIPHDRGIEVDYTELAVKTIKMPRVQLEEQKGSAKGPVSEQKAPNSSVHKSQKAELVRNSMQQ